MRSYYVILLLVLLTSLFLWQQGARPKSIPQNQTCDQTSCPWPSNEQRYQREQQKQYLDLYR